MAWLARRHDRQRFASRLPSGCAESQGVITQEVGRCRIVTGFGIIIGSDLPFVLCSHCWRLILLWVRVGALC